MTKFYSVSIVLICLLAFQSCFSIIRSARGDTKDTFGNADKWLPPDFVAIKTTLLIEKIYFPKKQQELIADYMEKNYGFKYEFITLDDLKNHNPKYSDSTVYRFVILNSKHTHQMNVGASSGSGGYLPVTMVDFYFLDRLHNKEYPPTGRGSSYASRTFIKMMNTYLQ